MGIATATPALAAVVYQLILKPMKMKNKMRAIKAKWNSLPPYKKDEVVGCAIVFVFGMIMLTVIVVNGLGYLNRC